MRRVHLRNADAGELVEDFLIAAVAAILGLRVVLHLTGYPRLAPGTLHIAHMLPGGLLMLVALILLLGYLGSSVKHVAAVVGGAGYGTFIDELGKFVTRDNDYFFEPTAALIYVIFVATYLAFRATRRRPLAPEEALANALEVTLEALRHDLDPDERARALKFLRQGDREDPVVQALEEALRRIQAIPAPRASPFTRIKAAAQSVYQGLVRKTWFGGAVVVFFVAHSVATLLRSVLAVRVMPRLSFFEWGDLLSSAAPGVLVLLGIFHIARSRLRAYRYFQRAVLVSVFITQFFAFYHAQFVAAAGLLWNLLIFATLRYMIHQEERLEASPGFAAARSPPGPRSPPHPGGGLSASRR